MYSFDWSEVNSEMFSHAARATYKSIMQILNASNANYPKSTVH